MSRSQAKREAKHFFKKYFSYICNQSIVCASNVQMTDFDDLYYIERIKAGEVNAFTPIVRYYQRMVLTVVIKIVGNKEEAEDITQEIFIKVFKSLDKFKGESEFSTWLYRIAYNTTLSEMRKKHLVFTSFEDSYTNVNEEDISEEMDDLDSKDKMQYLDQALKSLPPEDALIITLYYLNELSIEEVSKIISQSTANVKVRLHRIRKRLNTEINNLIMFDSNEGISRMKEMKK